MIKNLIAVLIVVMVSGCTTLQKELKNYVKQPEVSYKSISIGKVSTSVIELNPTFNIANNNNFSIPIDAVTYDLSFNNKKMLSGEKKSIGLLPANNGKDITLSLDLTEQTLTSLQQLLFKDKKLDYQVKGGVKTMGLTIPFEKSATLYVPEISIKEVKMVKGSFTQLDILLSVDLNNPNEFVLPLGLLNYTVSSSGKTLFKGDLKNNKISTGKNNIQLPLTIKPGDLFSTVFGLLSNPTLPLHFEISSPMFKKSHDQSLDLSSFF
ncbi:Water Stress and Hypersensitive response [Psychromonas ingrahamii 37]|uniref:Water Stress and Hypersensitive response n=1 Tax=Psychromonas ingrahamii (strain DSM 17664 / CCUG 51855 / 37) TaxID=357804 RepID=A1SY98_PSYIN|nr:LEA type 2 family protein [Psychromonas ingrahamii]ABM04463.1 Water Stress and Hypersensitive response [Psychromonas ingrahamii 37]